LVVNFVGCQSYNSFNLFLFVEVQLTALLTELLASFLRFLGHVVVDHVVILLVVVFVEGFYRQIRLSSRHMTPSCCLIQLLFLLFLLGDHLKRVQNITWVSHLGAVNLTVIRMMVPVNRSVIVCVITYELTFIAVAVEVGGYLLFIMIWA